MLGLVGQHHEADPRLSLPAFLLDYIIGIIVASLFWGHTLGSMGGGPSSFMNNIHSADTRHVLFAIACGAVFNVANLLLVAAIEIAGLAVAFPIGIGLALVVGAMLNYAIAPQGNPLLLFGGVLLVAWAIIVDAMAYRRRETTQQKLSARGIQISLACGVLMGIFYPLVAKAISGEGSLGPYSVALFFALGTAVCAIPVNYFLMRHPLAGTPPVSMSGYGKARGSFHLCGDPGRLHLVHRRCSELRGIARCHHRPRDFVLYWTRCDDGERGMGRLRLVVSSLPAPAPGRPLIPLMFAFLSPAVAPLALAPVFH